MGLNIILLAAGRGSRMGEVTSDCHKSLLPIGDRPVLEYLLDEIAIADIDETIVVTGHRQTEISSFLEGHDLPTKVVHNSQYRDDTNILSVELGVSALRSPEDGYLILETDVIVQKSGWNDVFSNIQGEQSRWLTHNQYSQSLTGGAVLVSDSGDIEDMVYAPQYDSKIEGWKKLLGGLYVAKPQVFEDRRLRSLAIKKSIAQYYMSPWVKHLNQLPCMNFDLSSYFAASFNDVNSYKLAEKTFLSLDP